MSEPIGQPPVIQQIFTDPVSGNPTDVATNSLLLQAPDGTQSTLGNGSFSHAGTGTYRLPIPACTQKGEWSWTWTTTGPAFVVQGTFEIYDEQFSARQQAVRSTMAQIIGRLRRLLNDQAGPSQVFDDVELQDFLDARRLDVRYLELYADITYPPANTGGGVQFLKHYDQAMGGMWEADLQVVNSAWTDITSTTSSIDYMLGIVTFATSTRPPLFVTGKTYDLYGAACDACRSWANKVALDFDFSADQSQFMRSQKQKMLLAQAVEFSKRARAMPADLIRSDTW